jgi:hypothetical protein
MGAIIMFSFVICIALFFKLKFWLEEKRHQKQGV